MTGEEKHLAALSFDLQFTLIPIPFWWTINKAFSVQGQKVYRKSGDHERQTLVDTRGEHAQTARTVMVWERDACRCWMSNDFPDVKRRQKPMRTKHKGFDCWLVRFRFQVFSTTMHGDAQDTSLHT